MTAPMTVDDWDQYGMLQADWGRLYDITRNPDEPRPFRAVPRDDPGTVLQAETPRELREMVRDHHAARPAGSGGTS